MLILHIAIALPIAICVWYALSRGLAQVIFATEARRPAVGQSTVWSAFEAASTVAVFLLSAGVWVGLTYLFEWLSR
jgi:hypothetical protein